MQDFSWEIINRKVSGIDKFLCESGDMTEDKSIIMNEVHNFYNQLLGVDRVYFNKSHVKEINRIIYNFIWGDAIESV